MGFLKAGNPLSFSDSKKHLNKVRQSGLSQFLNHYNRCRLVRTPRFLWGDELEYGIFSNADDCGNASGNENETEANGASKRSQEEENECYDLSVRGHEIRAYLANLEDEFIVDSELSNAETVSRTDSDLSNPSERRMRSGSWTDHCSSHAPPSVFEDVVAREGLLGCSWMPEYGAWMVEVVPAEPYIGSVEDLMLAQQSMQLRGQRLHMALKSHEIAPSMSNFPMLGVDGYRHYPEGGKRGGISNSHYIRDEIINPHPRFGTLSRNIRTRRGCNVNIVGRRDVEIFEEDDRNSSTALGSVEKREKYSKSDSQKPPLSPNEVHMDAMAFGMGCCCLQVTMQAFDDEESRFLHDQLTPLAPFFLAISAATPLFRGTLMDTDTRWEFIGRSVDCRNDVERGVSGASSEPDPEIALQGIERIPNSRYSGVSAYIAKPRNDSELKALESLNDLGTVVDEQVVEMLVNNGLDIMLARHIAHLFIRDPMVIFDDAINLDDEKVTDHFENFQSTNWRTMRWKTPSIEIGLEAERRQAILDELKKGMKQVEEKEKADDGSDQPSSADDEDWFQRNLESFGPGWRVEFRPLEISLTDFENAAYAVSIVLLARAILALGLNFYTPLSLVEANMARSERKDACLKEKFYVPRNALKYRNMQNPSTSSRIPEKLVDDDLEIIELTCNELFNGTSDFKGIIPVIRDYLNRIGATEKSLDKLNPYLDLLSNRASGKVPTTARWIRDYVTSHADYKGDGNLSQRINDDLCRICDDIGMGVVQKPDLIGTGVEIPNLNCVPAKQAAPFKATNAAQVEAMKGKVEKSTANKPCTGCKDLSKAVIFDGVTELSIGPLV